MMTRFSKRAVLLVCALGTALVSNAQLTFNLGSTGTLNGGTGNQDFTFNVSGLTASVTAVKLNLAFDFSFNSGSFNSLSLSLIAPNGASAALATHPTATDGIVADDLDITFQDGTTTHGAFNNLAFGSSPLTGTYNAQGGSTVLSTAFSGLSAANANGTWKLRIVDSTAGDNGSVYAPGSTPAWGGTTTGTSLQITAVPEPAAYAMIFGIAMLGVAAFRRFQVKLA